MDSSCGARSRSFRLLFASALFALSGVTLARPVNDVYVIGTLYKRHADVPAFSTDVLRRVIADIKPQVLVLDVTPNELRDRRVHPSKIEYPQAIFPFVEEAKLPTYAAEPDEPLFTSIQDEIRAIFKRSNAANPAQQSTLDAHSKATYEALKLHWQSAADVQDALTGTALTAKERLADTLTPGMAKIGEDWDRHTADVAVRAAKEHPGKRVLVLTGLQNRPLVLANLKAAKGINLVDMETWLRANGYGD